ncbi:G-protein coupled receptor 56-like [Sinocyclocheilus grahami]|uniref:G-protein coupled receptor 56-like n=1 Tax=Sinocyclocheilus grahami TaxID=75366 RepID=UPI0007ACD0F3|nr:PREDICTED: G-protein coupled receptor 56-like [Sinocyclocheilus grahami]
MTSHVYTDPSKASKALDNLESKMEEMEKSNKSNAAIVMGDVIGLLHVQAKNTETKDINICYSSNHTMVVESQSVQNTNCSWSIKISKEAFDKSRLENNGSAFVGVLRFKNIGNKNENDIHTVLNNEVYGITMRAKISNLTDNIDMSFTHNDKNGNVSCVSWDGKGRLNWTTFGCKTEINNNSIKCSCSHLTFFAVLMFLPDANVTAPHLESLTLISSIGCGISMFFMAVTLFMHFLLRIKVQVTFCVSSIKSVYVFSVCPAPIVVAIASIGGYEAVTLNTTSGKIARMCWTTNPYIHYIVNIGYYALVFVFTTGVFIMIVTKVVQARNIKAVDGKRKTFRKQLMMVLSLFLLFGLTWSVAFFSYGPMLIPSYYIFTVLNSLQGFFLFLYYYHIHNDVEGNFSDDPESTDSTV